MTTDLPDDQLRCSDCGAGAVWVETPKGITIACSAKCGSSSFEAAHGLRFLNVGPSTVEGITFEICTEGVGNGETQ